MVLSAYQNTEEICYDRWTTYPQTNLNKRGLTLKIDRCGRYYLDSSIFISAQRYIKAELKHILEY